MGVIMSIEKSIIKFNSSSNKKEFDIHLCAELISKVAFEVFEAEDEKVTSFLSIGKFKEKSLEVA